MGDKSKVVSIGTITKSEKSPHLETSITQQLLQDPPMTMDPNIKTPPTSVLPNPFNRSMLENAGLCVTLFILVCVYMCMCNAHVHTPHMQYILVIELACSQMGNN